MLLTASNHPSHGKALRFLTINEKGFTQSASAYAAVGLQHHGGGKELDKGLVAAFEGSLEDVEANSAP